MIRPLGAAAGAAVGLAVLGIACCRRLRVEGHSMEPTLLPGDRVVVLRRPRLRPRPGDVVALRDPRQPARVILKRVAAASAAGLDVRGDRPAASTDSRTFGLVDPALVVGRVVYRYHPVDRAGPLRRGVVPSPGAGVGTQ